jgi:NADPH:quinone reductase-like Zn-dependent oxidoreductase
MSLRRRILTGLAAVVLIAVVSLCIAISYESPCGTAAPLPAGTERMKSVRAHCYGPPSVLQLEDVAKPVIEDDQVLVKVRAASVNPADWHAMRGEPYFIRMFEGLGAPTESLMGVDYAGTVEAVGKNVTGFKPGDNVFGGRNGALSEYVPVRHDRNIVHLPQNVTFDEAAGVYIAALTALQGLRDHGQLRAGQKVLINGASGGVGTFAIQIAKSMGAEVTAVCSTRNLELVRALGADFAVDYTKENFTDREVQYDMILDNVSTQSLSNMRRVLKPQGRLVIVGGTSRDPWIGPLWSAIKAYLLSPFVDQPMGLFIAQSNPADLAVLAQLLREGKMKTVIDRRYPLSEAAAAIEYLETGRARGKVIVTVSRDAA